MAETTKGMFFNNTLNFIVKKKGPELKAKISKEIGKPLNYISFRDYPIQEYVALQEEAIKEIYPGKKQPYFKFVDNIVSLVDKIVIIMVLYSLWWLFVGW